MRKINRDNCALVFASADWGFTHAGTLEVWITDGDGRMFLIHEVYQTKRTVEWWVTKALELAELYGGFDAIVCDPSQPAHIAQMQEAGLPAVAADNDVLIGISRVAERLKPAEDGLPRLFVLSDCLKEIDRDLEEAKKPTSLLAEIDGYVWNDKSKKDEPLKVDDHGVDALRYAVMFADNPRTHGGIFV